MAFLRLSRGGTIMSTLTEELDASLAATVAGEDLRCGDYVAILSEVYEFPSFLWCGDAALLPPHEPVRMKLLSRTNGAPLKVKAICLPFLFVKSAKDEYETLDVRRQQLVRLDRRYAETVYKSTRK